MATNKEHETNRKSIFDGVDRVEACDAITELVTVAKGVSFFLYTLYEKDSANYGESESMYIISDKLMKATAQVEEAFSI